MPVPLQLTRPVKRPFGDLITNAAWQGPDDDLELVITYLDSMGMNDTVAFTTANTSESRLGEICLPLGYGVNELDSDTLISHISMGGFIAGAIPPSFEWQTMFIEQAGSKDFQTAIGEVAVASFELVSDVEFQLDVKLKGDTTIRSIVATIDQFTDYVFSPSTQLKVVSGSVKKQFANYVHEYPGTILSASRRQDVIDYIGTLEIWA